MQYVTTVARLQVFASLLFLASFYVINTSAVNTTEISSRIIGGSPVTTPTFPWHATLRTSTRFCGGSLIHPSWILTAAHCIVGSTGVTVRLGSLLCHSGGTLLSLPSSAYHVNPYYIPASLANDIALIKLVTPVAISSTIDAIKLFPRAKCCPATSISKYLFSGCGTINGPAMPVNLRSAVLVDMPDILCLPTPNTLPIGTMCAASAVSNTCIDDDGGALVVPGTIFQQVGVLSFSAPSCTSSVLNTKSRFIRVCMYHDWIQATTGINLG